MTDRKRLGRHVTIGGKTYGPKDDLPPEVAEQIRNPKAWIPDGEAPEEDDPNRPAGTASGHRLASTISVDGRTYGPKDPLPDHVARKILNPKAWAGGNAPHFDDEDTDSDTGPAGDRRPAAKKTAPSAKDKAA
jgi:hypothetical protein